MVKPGTNAATAAALRVLADFIFAICFHIVSHNHFPYRHARIEAAYSLY